MIMTFDATISLGTMIHLGSMLVAIGIVYGALNSQMKEILRRLGCAEEKGEEQGHATLTIIERLRALEKDVDWLKEQSRD